MNNLVSVKTASLRDIPPDDPLRVFHSKLRPLVGPGMVSGGDPVDDPKPGAKILKLSRCEHLSSVRCEGDGDAVGGDESPHGRDEVGRGVGAELDNVDPVGEAADDDEVGLFGTQLEEVSTDRLEGIGRVLGNNWRHGRIARGKPGALSTGCSVIDEVLSEVGPVERGGSSLKHGRG